METQKSLKVHHVILQEKEVLRMTVNVIMHHLPLLGEDEVVLLDGILDHVGRCQYLLAILLSIRFDPTNLGCMGPPFYFHIVHL